MQPIVLVTVEDRPREKGERDGEEEEQPLYGLTASTLTTVALHPHPVISLSIKRPSRTLNAIYSQGGFSVQFLKHTPNAIALAKMFTVDAREAFARMRQLNGFASLRHKSEWPYAPLILAPSAVLSTMICELDPTRTTDIHDHSVIFARVSNVELSDREAQGLGYAHGSYGGKPGPPV